MKTRTLLLIGVVALALAGFRPPDKQKLNKQLENYCTEVVNEFDMISKERQENLKDIGAYIHEKRKAGEDVNLLVICTHNSRRSHMGQLWLYAAAAWYGVEDVSAYSGGTEATAFNPRAVQALRRAGFKINNLNAGDNPPYEASYLKGNDSEGVHMYSKKFGDRANPTKNFAAIMVCSEADASCPVVPGADARVAVPFDDPRYYDNTASEELEYDKTVRLIAREMFYAMNHAKQLLVMDKELQK